MSSSQHFKDLEVGMLSDTSRDKIPETKVDKPRLLAFTFGVCACFLVGAILWIGSGDVHTSSSGRTNLGFLPFQIWAPDCLLSRFTSKRTQTFPKPQLLKKDDVIAIGFTGKGLGVFPEQETTVYLKATGEDTELFEGAVVETQRGPFMPHHKIKLVWDGVLWVLKLEDSSNSEYQLATVFGENNQKQILRSKDGKLDHSADVNIADHTVSIRTSTELFGTTGINVCHVKKTQNNGSFMLFLAMEKERTPQTLTEDIQRIRSNSANVTFANQLEIGGTIKLYSVFGKEDDAKN